MLKKFFLGMLIAAAAAGGLAFFGPLHSETSAANFLMYRSRDGFENMGFAHLGHPAIRLRGPQPGNFPAQLNLLHQLDLIGLSVEGQRGGCRAAVPGDGIFTGHAIRAQRNARHLELSVLIRCGETNVTDGDLREGYRSDQVRPHE